MAWIFTKFPKIAENETMFQEKGILFQTLSFLVGLFKFKFLRHVFFQTSCFCPRRSPFHPSPGPSLAVWIMQRFATRFSGCQWLNEGGESLVILLMEKNPFQPGEVGRLSPVGVNRWWHVLMVQKFPARKPVDVKVGYPICSTRFLAPSQVVFSPDFWNHQQQYP